MSIHILLMSNVTIQASPSSSSSKPNLSQTSKYSLAGYSDGSLFLIKLLSLFSFEKLMMSLCSGSTLDLAKIPYINGAVQI